MTTPVRFDTKQSVVFEVNEETRTIKGLLLPYDAIGNNGEGRYRFARGSVVLPADLSRVKLLINHDFSQAVGYATALEDTDAGVVGTFKVARGAEGDRALGMASDRVWDGLSAGLGGDAQFKPGKDGVFDAISAPIVEGSLTPLPAFDDARVTSVAASAARPSNKENNMPEDNTLTEEKPVVEGAVTLSAADITKAVQDGMAAALTTFTGPPAPAPRAGGPLGSTFVNEAPLYRFDGVRGEHDFSADLILGMGLGGRTPDGEAYERVLKFMGEQLGPKFVTTTDTSAVTPTGYRADMFVNEQRFKSPLYDALYKGALTDVTPFAFAKFNTGTGLVADHVQGTEPTNGTYTTASAATVTPAPVSGKVHITREVADQGGNPQVSALIWDKIVYEYRKAMETKIATMLDASAATELGAAIAQGANTVAGLAVPLEQAIAALNFAAGGDRFNFAAAHIDLYLALAGLKDGQNRAYFPIINPSNATGTASGGYKSLDVAGTRFDPVWSLGATSAGAAPAEKSYLIDTSAVHFWASAPTKLDRLQEKVEGYDLGVWGYWAGVISDLTGVRKISYDLA